MYSVSCDYILWDVGANYGRCDSYNTARLRIVSGPGHTENAIDEIESRMRESSESLARGRAISIGNQLRAVSASAIDLDSHRGGQFVRNAQSTSPTILGRFASSRIHDGGSDTMETSDDEEVDFWGGESPRDRTLQEIGDNSVASESASSDDDDEDDELMVMDDLDEEDDDDRMAIFGHR